MKKKKKAVRGVFIASMAVIGVGFAALSNINLKITGEASVGPNTEAFNVKLTKVYDDDNPIKCTIIDDYTASCTANLKEAYDYEDFHNSYGNVMFDLKYTGSSDYKASVYPAISVTGNTESINVGVYTNGGMSEWNRANPLTIESGETKAFHLFMNSANAKSGDKIEFEVKLVAKPVSNK